MWSTTSAATPVLVDILPDGRFVMVRSPDQSTAREIVLVRNWFEELKRHTTP